MFQLPEMKLSVVIGVTQRVEGFAGVFKRFQLWRCYPASHGHA